MPADMARQPGVGGGYRSGSRLGLRYLHAVLPGAGENAREYLVGGLHGIDFNADAFRKAGVAHASAMLMKRTCNPHAPRVQVDRLSICLPVNVAGVH